MEEIKEQSAGRNSCFFILIHLRYDLHSTSIDEAQDKAVKAFLNALQAPYEKEPEIDETEYLLSTEANGKTL